MHRSRTPIALFTSVLLAASGLLSGPIESTVAAPRAGLDRQPAESAQISTSRLGGADRYETAAIVSAAFFPNGATTAFVATGREFPDSLAAAPIARSLGAPVLLTLPGSIPAATANEITRLNAQHIVVVGGSGAVSPGVFSQLSDMVPNGATRIGGADRYETAAQLSATYTGAGAPVFVATGDNYPDALSGGGAAGAVNGALLLVQLHGIPASTASELQRIGPSNIYIAGGTGVISGSVEQQLAAYGPVTRLAGPDRYETSAAISRAIFPDGAASAFVASGQNFPDALTASPVAGLQPAPVLLTQRFSLPASVASELSRLEPGTVYVIGGEGVISSGVESEIAALSGAPQACTAGNLPAPGAQQLFRTIPGATNQVALTFDMNGPTAPSLEMLQYLADAGVCTTIFPDGNFSQTAAGQQALAFVASRPDIFELGNHTMHHCDLANGSPGEPACPDGHATAGFVAQELAQLNELIVGQTGMSTAPFWRPPYGSYTGAILDAAANAGYTKTFMWDIDTRDWVHVSDGGPTAGEMANLVITNAGSGSIVLMHTGGWNTPEAVPMMVEGLRDRGFVLTSLSDMLD